MKAENDNEPDDKYWIKKAIESEHEGFVGLEESAEFLETNKDA
jgi:hypothetical protein